MAEVDVAAGVGVSVGVARAGVGVAGGLGGVPITGVGVSVNEAWISAWRFVSVGSGEGVGEAVGDNTTAGVEVVGVDSETGEVGAHPSEVTVSMAAMNQVSQMIISDRRFIPFTITQNLAVNR